MAREAQKRPLSSSERIMATGTVKSFIAFSDAELNTYGGSTEAAMHPAFHRVTQEDVDVESELEGD